MPTREAPAWFRQELRRRFGSGHDAEWDGVLQRWVIISPSVAGYPTRQPVMWFRDPHTGEPTTPDVAGILPFRDLDDDCCFEILRNMEQTSLTNRHDGAQTIEGKIKGVLAFNAALEARQTREAARAWADAIAEVDLRRPWLKHHSGSHATRRVARGV